MACQKFINDLVGVVYGRVRTESITSNVAPFAAVLHAANPDETAAKHRKVKGWGSRDGILGVLSDHFASAGVSTEGLSAVGGIGK